MNKKLLFGACGIAAASSLFAEGDVSYFNPYISVKSGFSILSNRDDVKYRNGFLGAVEFGVSYDAWRLGLELAYRQNKVRGFTGNKTSGTETNPKAESSFFMGKPIASGLLDPALARMASLTLFSKIRALSGMINVYYDYALTDEWTLFAGVGLGVAKVSFLADRALVGFGANDEEARRSAIMAVSVEDERLQSHKVDSEISKTVFAWQIMFGCGYDVSENWTLTAGYRLFNTAKIRLFGTNVKAPFSNSFEVGVRYNF